MKLSLGVTGGNAPTLLVGLPLSMVIRASLLNKEARITIDSGKPTSSVGALPPVTPRESFIVTWSGSDDAGGSGVGTYDIFVSTDGGQFEPWLSGVDSTSATFQGQYGHSYAFQSVARDNVDNLELTTATAVASTVVVPTWLEASGGAAFAFSGNPGARTLQVNSGTLTFGTDASIF